MKRVSCFAMVLSLCLIIAGCQSSIEKQSYNYASDAFSELIDYVDSYIQVSKVDWICFDALDEDEDIVIGCYYYVHFQRDKSNVERYAEIQVREYSWITQLDIDVYTYDNQKAMDDEYDSELSWLINTGSIISLSYETGSLNRIQIRRALKSIQ